MYRSQQVVSRQIANLERELGFSLFERTTKRVALTSQAEALFPAWKSALKEIDRSVKEAVKQGARRKNTLRIGIVDAYKALSIAKRGFAGYLDIYKEKDNVVILEHHALSAGRLADMLIWDDIDIIIVMASELEGIDVRDIEIRILQKLEEYIIFSKRHPFAQKSDITTEDLSGETLLLLSHEFSHAAEAFILKILKDKGVTPGEIQYVDTINSLELTLYSGKGFTVAPDMFFENAGGYLVFRHFPMEEKREEALVAAWSKKNKNLRIYEFADYLANLLENSVG
jgi:DNA-binding transcriptional LysR family regulator